MSLKVRLIRNGSEDPFPTTRGSSIERPGKAYRVFVWKEGIMILERVVAIHEGETGERYTYY